MTPHEFNLTSDDALARLRAKLTGVPYVKRQALTGYNSIRMHSFRGENLPAVLSDMARFISENDATGSFPLNGFPPVGFEWRFTHEADVEAGEHIIYLWQMG